jgi:hypothetical protein
MKIIERVIIHSTGTDTKAKAKDCAYQNGKPLYHYIIERDGEVKQCSREAWSINNDYYAIHIGFIGGIDHEGNHLDNRTSFQKEAMFYKLVELSSRYNNLDIAGAEGKTHPAFDVKQWMNAYQPTFALDREEMAMAA